MSGSRSGKISGRRDGPGFIHSCGKSSGDLASSSSVSGAMRTGERRAEGEADATVAVRTLAAAPNVVVVAMVVVLVRENVTSAAAVQRI